MYREIQLDKFINECADCARCVTPPPHAARRTPLNQVMIYEQRSATLHSKHTFDRLHSQYTRHAVLCSLTECLVLPTTRPAASTTVLSPQSGRDHLALRKTTGMIHTISSYSFTENVSWNKRCFVTHWALLFWCYDFHMSSKRNYLKQTL